MVNTEDDDEPKGDQFDVDGKYVPRIFFLGKNTGETSTSKIYRISSRFFENEPNGICSHLCEKEPKGRVFCARLARNHTSEGKGKEEKKKERGGRNEKKREREKKPMVALCFSILAPLESFWPKKMLDGRGLFGGNVFSKIRLDVMYCNIRIPLRSIITLGKRTINYHQLCFSYLTQGPMFRCLSKVNEHGVAQQLIRGNLMSRKALP